MPLMYRYCCIYKETLDTGSFKAQGGGFKRLNDVIFKGKLEEIISKVKIYMFENKEIS
ncbi:hypothetical protein [Clostridium lundense]|uniref:hypothetical protein n=1 Tax=Clostridium lundense TaxID=319475 RepID=UPI000AB5A9BD|nr:hypothetical protein [Clostridium lundense]